MSHLIVIYEKYARDKWKKIDQGDILNCHEIYRDLVGHFELIDN